MRNASGRVSARRVKAWHLLAGGKARALEDSGEITAPVHLPGFASLILYRTIASFP